MSNTADEVPGVQEVPGSPAIQGSHQVPQVFDRGLQVERTALSWQRTALAVTAGSLLGARVLAPSSGWFGIGLGVLGALLGLFVLLRAGIRSRRVHRVLTSNDGTTVAEALLEPLPGAAYTPSPAESQSQETIGSWRHRSGSLET